MEDNKTKKIQVKLDSYEPTGIVIESQELSMVTGNYDRLYIHIGECLYRVDKNGYIIDRVIPHEESVVSKDFYIYHSEKTNHNKSDDIAVTGARYLDEAIAMFKKYYTNASAENVRIIDCNTDGLKREEMKTMNLDKSGLLHGLSGINYETIKSYMENIDYNRIKRDETIQCIAPAIRVCLCKILDTENQFYIFKREPNTQIKIMSMFNVNEIIDGLDTLYAELLPNIDNQAELTALFCDNYVHTLVKKVSGIYCNLL